MKSEITEIEIAPDAAPEILAQAPLALSADPVARMLEKIVAGGITAESVGALEKLADLYERLAAKDAEKQFTAAFVALQAELPTIVATTVIPNRGKYEKFEDVMRVVSPLLRKHGFSVSFAMTTDATRVTETCHLRHLAGHAASNSFSVRVGRADSETQADCKAATTAKRNALLNCLNIVIRQDAYQDEGADAALEGAPISRDQAQILREMVRDTASNEEAFLKFAGATTYEEIGDARYASLFAALQKKAKK